MEGCLIDHVGSDGEAGRPKQKQDGLEVKPQRPGMVSCLTPRDTGPTQRLGRQDVSRAALRSPQLNRGVIEQQRGGEIAEEGEEGGNRSDEAGVVVPQEARVMSLSGRLGSG